MGEIMTLEQYAYLAEIIGAILVIASLIYVARQLNQNTAMIRAESRNEIHHSHQQELFAVMQNPDVWRSVAGEELDDQNVRTNIWLTACLRAREHEWFQFQHGALDESAWRSYSTAIPLVLASERSRAWWGVMKPAYDTRFVEVVDELLENEALNPIQKQLTEIGETPPTG